MRRREFVAAGVIATSACGARVESPLRDVSVALSEHLSVSTMYLADESGYVRQAGFQFKPMRISALQAIPLLASGKLDVILGGVPSQLLNAVARGMNIKVVAGREYVSPSCGEGYVLYAHREAFKGGAIDPRRLRGRRFSVRSRGITEFILDSFLKHFGMKPEDVDRVDLPLKESLAALAGGKIDALFDIEISRSPLATSPEIVKVWRFAEVQPFHQYSFVIFGDSLLKAGLGPGSRFLAAYLAAAGDFLDGRTPKFMREFAATHGLDVEKTVAGCRDTFPRDGAIDLPSMQRSIDWNVSKGYATRALRAEEIVDTKFLMEGRRLLASGQWRVAAAAGGSGA
jgi:NitT/TauT family transport system substrate-binding protein